MERASTLRNVLVASCMVGALACGEGDQVQTPSSTEQVSATAPGVTENGDLRVYAPPGETATVMVQSRVFADMAELYAFALDEMGGEPVYDEAGELIGVHGVSIASGDVRYLDEDTGESFAARDLAQAYLGGAAGTIEVAGETLEVADPEGSLGTTSVALSDDSQGCIGQDCISGHSWKTNYVVYRSVGSETKQTSGGYGTVSYTCCPTGTLVTYQGVRQCRVVTEWEPADPENGVYKPIPIAYGYRPTQTCSYTTTRNTLTLGVTAISPSGFPAASTTRTESNTREVEISAWGVGLGVDFLGIDDVAGVCGFHTGSRGATTRTRAGNASNAQCENIGGASDPVRALSHVGNVL